MEQIAADVVKMALERGASDAEATVAGGDDFSVEVRLGEVEHALLPARQILDRDAATWTHADRRPKHLYSRSSIGIGEAGLELDEQWRRERLLRHQPGV